MVRSRGHVSSYPTIEITEGSPANGEELEVAKSAFRPLQATVAFSEGHFPGVTLTTRRGEGGKGPLEMLPVTTTWVLSPREGIDTIEFDHMK